MWQQERLRWLDFDDGAVQSIIDLDHPDQLVSPVQHAMLAPILFVPISKRILLLGVGGGALARYFNHRFPAVQGEAVVYFKINLDELEITMDTIEVSFPGGKRIDAKVGNFVIHTDQSEKYGGSASAPEPFDLFLASIATCAGIFAWNFCEIRELSTDGMALHMDCERDEKKKLFSHIVLRLTLPADFPEKYQKGILRAMELCTVKRHMMDSPAFSIELK